MMRVLFVDDEPNILNGLRRIMRTMRDKWNMEFLSSGQEALDFAASTHCDVIISDMKMPGMDGAHLLSQFRERFPDSIRIALSGETDMNMIYRCVQHAHQYIAKPCDAAELVATVQRAYTLRAILKDQTLKTLVSSMSTLPSIPEHYRKIMQELQSDDPSMRRVAEIVELDVAMTAKILQIVNSAFFGLARTVSSASEAAMLLGLDVIKALALTTGVFSQFEDAGLDEKKLHAIWSDSMQVGALARRICEDKDSAGLVADYAYLGGMMANIGKLIFAANMPDKLQEVARRAEEEGRAEWELERELIGPTHMEAGAYLVGLWGLPYPVVECVAFQHEPERCHDTGLTPVVAVHVAKAIVSAHGGTDLPGLHQDFIESLGLAGNIAPWQRIHNDELAAA